jgi:outer membrane autotransporter protein
VHFTSSDGSAVLPANATLTNGVGTFTATLKTAGTQTITATDTATASITGTSGPVNVGQPPSASTTVTLASSPNPSTSGEAVTFTATVGSGGGTPAGTVTFLDGGHPIGTGVLAAGVATFTTASLTIGEHFITADYGGATGFLASTSATLNQAVNMPLDSVRLRTMQVEGAQIEAQASGDAISEAIAAAIEDGFSDRSPFAAPSANGVHINFAGQLASAGAAVPDATNAPDPALGRAAVLSDLGATSPMRSLPNAQLASSPATLPNSPNTAQPSQAPTLVGAPQAWLVWADARGSGWNTGSSTGDIRGTQTNELVGITRRLSPDLLIGALGGYEHFDYSSQLLNGRLQGDGWTAGGYLGWRIDEQLRFDAAIARSGVSYDAAAGTATGSFPGSRWIASTGLTGTYKFEPFELQPSARVFTLWEHEQPYTDTLGTPQAGFSFTTGRASSGLKVSYPLSWSPTTILTPYVGFYGDYYFSNNNNTTPLLLPSEIIRGGAARVTAGISARFDDGIRITLGAEYGGIGNNFQNWTVNGRVVIPLSTLFGSGPSTATRAAAPEVAAAPALTPQAHQVASLEQVAAVVPTTTARPAVASVPDEAAPTRSTGEIFVRFSQNLLVLTPSGIRALDEVVAARMAGQPMHIVIEGCEAKAVYSKGSLCARRALSLMKLLAARGMENAGRLMAELQ